MQLLFCLTVPEITVFAINVELNTFLIDNKY